MIKLLLLLLAAGSTTGAEIRRGVAVLRASAYFKSKSPDAAVLGTVTFTQDESSGLVEVEVTASGLIGADGDKRGFHVHQFGDSTDTMTVDTLGVHLTPSCTATCKNDSTHGFPPSPVRQWGDMGNLVLTDGAVDLSGQKTMTLGQNKMSLTADGIDGIGVAWNQRSIVGRAVVIHFKEDDGTQPFGAAGAPLAWGIIGIASPGPGDTNVAASYRTERIVCVFQKTQNDIVVEGTALVTMPSYKKNILRIEAKLTNLDAGDHSFHFHEWGDLTVPTADLGSIYKDTGVDIKTLTATGSSETVFKSNFAGTSADITKLAGRMLTIHSGPDKSYPTIGTAICGRAAPNTKLFEEDSKDGSNAAPQRAAWAGAAPLAIALGGLAIAVAGGH